MDWMKGIFSGEMDAARVHPAGLILMLLALALVMLAERIALKLNPGALEHTKNAIKITGLIICAGGALLAILG